MTKADLVNEIAKETGIDKKDILLTVETMMEVIKTSLTDNENVYLRGFGSFIVKKRAEKTARNISKNTISPRVRTWKEVYEKIHEYLDNKNK